MFYNGQELQLSAQRETDEYHQYSDDDKQKTLGGHRKAYCTAQITEDSAYKHVRDNTSQRVERMREGLKKLGVIRPDLGSGVGHNKASAHTDTVSDRSQ